MRSCCEVGTALPADRMRPRARETMVTQNAVVPAAAFASAAQLRPGAPRMAMTGRRRERVARSDLEVEARSRTGSRTVHRTVFISVTAKLAPRHRCGPPPKRVNV